MKTPTLRQTLIVVTLCVLAVLFLTASSVVPFAINLIQNNGTPLTKRPTLNFTTNMTCVDDSGNNSTDCSSSGGSSANGGVTVFSGSAITLLSTQYLAIGGGAAVSSTEANVEIQSPAAATISNLSVQLSAALGLSTSAVFTWRDSSSSQALTCTISGASATTCTDNTHSFNAAQGDELDIQVVTTGTPSAVTIVIATAFGTVATNNPAFTISNATSTGTTVNTLTTLTGAPSTAVIVTAGATGGVVGITTAGAGTSGTATITTAGKIPCVFDGATTANDYVQISSGTNGDCHDTGAATYPTSGQVLGRVLSTNGSGGTYTLDLFPSEIQTSSGGGGFIQTLTAPVAANFTQVNYNTGSGVVTTQTNLTSPVTAITILQHDPNGTANAAALLKNKLASTFTVTEAFVYAGQGLVGLMLYDGSSENITVDIRSSAGFEADLFNNLGGSFNTFIFSPIWPFGTYGSLVWVRVQETASARNYYVSSDGQNFAQFYTESNTTHFTTAQYGFVSYARGAGTTNPDIIGTLYSFTETNP